MKSKKTIIVVVLILLLIGLAFKNYYDRQAIKRNGVYVIGAVEEVRGAYKGVKAFVIYKYRGEIIKSNFVTTQIYMNEKGKRFFFKINPKHPNKFKIEYKVKVPDSLLESPYVGWDSLPVMKSFQ